MAILEWSEENQLLVERFLVYGVGRNMCLAYTDKPSVLGTMPQDVFVDGQAIQDLMRELFGKPGLVIGSWDWSPGRDDSPSPRCGICRTFERSRDVRTRVFRKSEGGRNQKGLVCKACDDDRKDFVPV